MGWKLIPSFINWPQFFSLAISKSNRLLAVNCCCNLICVSAVLESERSLNLNQNKKGLFGGGTEQRNEYRRDQYTMDGTRNIGGGAIGEEGKMNAQSAECIAADAGARSQGAMAGSSIAAGLVVPAVANIPYVGWLAGGWALLLGQRAGSSIGSQVGQVFNDC